MSLTRSVSLTLAALVALGLASAPAARAATVIFSTTAPTAAPGDVLISNTSGATSDGTNVSGAQPFFYISGDRPAQGQFFTTGSNAAGYTLNSVSLQDVNYAEYSKTINANTFTVRVTQPTATTTITAMDTESAPVTANQANNFGNVNNTAGSGRYITFNLAAPVALLANTQYGFDVASTTTDQYFKSNGTNANGFFGAYNSGSNGAGNTTIAAGTGERVFFTDLTANVNVSPAPEPAQAAALGFFGLGLGALILKARKRSIGQITA